MFAAAVITGCGRQKSSGNFEARVDDSYLTDKNIKDDIDSAAYQPSRRNEYIRNWVETELFYLEAGREDILKDDDYKRALEKSSKELAKAFLIKKILNDNPIDIKAGELEEFYNSHKNEFRLSADSYHYNKIVFRDESKAIAFRSALLESDWTRATNAFSRENTLAAENPGIMEAYYDIQPLPLFAAIQELQPGEASIVLNPEPNEFVVVQLIRKYAQNEIPDYEAVKSIIRQKFVMRRQEQLIKEYLKGLYTKHKVELKSGK